MRVVLVVATCLVTACDRSRPAREEPARPREVTMACDSAAAMATRAGARQVRVVADTLMATEGRGCAVVIDGFPDSASVPSTFFHRGFSGGAWRLSRYESPNAATPTPYGSRQSSATSTSAADPRGMVVTALATKSWASTFSARR